MARKSDGPLALSFGSVAAAYERVRPSYPSAAIDWLVPDHARRILDLGAGTGKLTQQLTARGAHVVAVEPSNRMRAELRRALPEVRVLHGSAERIPLADKAVDVVVVGMHGTGLTLSALSRRQPGS